MSWPHFPEIITTAFKKRGNDNKSTQLTNNINPPLSTSHQRLGHDDADLALRHDGEVGEQALEDILAWPALWIDADGHHGWGTLFSLRTADWRDGRFTVSVPHGRGCENYTKSARTQRVKSYIANSSRNKRDRISYKSVYNETSLNRILLRSCQTWT